RLLVPGGRGPQFSPDGKWLAYWSGEIGASLYPGCAHIWIMPAAGGPPKQFRPNFTASAVPVWSPDSDRLLFLRRGVDPVSHETKVDWWVASVDGAFSRNTGLVFALGRRG